LVAPTRSSRDRNVRAAASLLVGLLAVAALPTAIALAEYADRYDLLQALWAVPIALVLGFAAVWLARRARVRIERTLGRVGGERTARVGRTLGVLGIMLGLSGVVAVGVYLVLTRFFE
jgi:small neutral amino acid transporter SnatA (MarC family)